MTKQLSPLEALERIKREAGTPYFSTLYDIDMWKEDFSTVETALKDYEKIKEENITTIDIGRNRKFTINYTKRGKYDI